MVRHETLRNEPVNTHLGEAHLDRYGVVTNESWIRGGGVALLGVPGFVDGELFPPREGFPVGYKPTVEAPPPEPISVEPVIQAASNVIIAHPPVLLPTGEVTEEMYWAVIRELSMEADNLNIKGYVDLEILTANLKVMGYPPLPGATRIQLTDKFRKLEASQSVVVSTGLPVEG